MRPKSAATATSPGRNLTLDMAVVYGEEYPQRNEMDAEGGPVVQQQEAEHHEEEPHAGDIVPCHVHPDGAPAVQQGCHYLQHPLKPHLRTAFRQAISSSRARALSMGLIWFHALFQPLPSSEPVAKPRLISLSTTSGSV